MISTTAFFTVLFLGIQIGINISPFAYGAERYERAQRPPNRDQDLLISEIEEVIRIENENPTSGLNVKERYMRFSMLLRGMLMIGKPIAEIISRAEAQEIESLIKKERMDDAARLLHEAILKLKQTNTFNSKGDIKQKNSKAKIIPEGKMKEIVVDFNSEKGIFSNYLFGTNSHPVYKEQGFTLAEESGFRLIEVNIVIDKSINDREVENFKNSIKNAFKIHADPLIWLLIVKPNKPDKNIILQNTKKIMNVLKNIDSSYSYLIRIGNEPDNKAMWRGTKEEFFEIYGDLAREIKSFNPKYIIGGISLMNGCLFKSDKGLDCDTLNDWLIDLLEYLKIHNIPIDFITIHAYSSIGYRNFYLQFSKVAELLEKYPTLSPLYGVPRLGNDEWNIMVGDFWSGSYHSVFDTAWAGTANVISWIAMVDSNLWLSVRYGGTFNDVVPGHGSKGHDFPLTTAGGEKKPSFFAFQALNSLAGTSRLMISESDYMNFAVVAGKNDERSFEVIMANFDVDSYFIDYPHQRKLLRREYQGFLSENKKSSPDKFNEFRLLIKNLPWKFGDKIVYERYIVDDVSDGIKLIETRELDGKSEITLSGQISSPAVYLLKIYKKN